MCTSNCKYICIYKYPHIHIVGFEGIRRKVHTIIKNNSHKIKVTTAEKIVWQHGFASYTLVNFHFDWINLMYSNTLIALHLNWKVCARMVSEDVFFVPLWSTDVSLWTNKIWQINWDRWPIGCTLPPMIMEVQKKRPWMKGNSLSSTMIMGERLIVGVDGALPPQIVQDFAY